MLAIQAEEGEGSVQPSEPQPTPSTAQHLSEEPIPTVVSSSHQKTQTPRQALTEATELPQTSKPIPNVADGAVYEEWDDIVEMATTTAASLDAEQASGNILKTQSTTMPNVPLPQGIGAGGSPRCQEATGVPLLRLGLRGLKTELKQTKQTYGVALTKLIKKVKKLKQTIKTSQVKRRAKIVVSDDEEASEDSSKQGRMIEEINHDAGITLVTPTHTKVQTYTRRRRAVSTVSSGISTASGGISTAGVSMPVSIAGMVQDPSPVVVKDKGKDKVDESEPEKIKIKVHEEASSFNVEEWEDIQATIEADKELALRIQAEEREKYFEAKKARLLIDLINQRKRHFA
ncbi:hypothetical protein Tco_0597747 [Tanacetum coccineum]